MFKVNNKDFINGVIPVSILLTRKYFTPFSSVSIVDFEHVGYYWAHNETLQ